MTDASVLLWLTVCLRLVILSREINTNEKLRWDLLKCRKQHADSSGPWMFASSGSLRCVMNFEHSSHTVFEFKHLFTSKITKEMVNINVYMSVSEYTYTYTLRLSQIFTTIFFQSPL